ncbi:MAG TPA: hypothetical protein VLV45_02750 [Gemmatimonadales bacterium]|nr:hypothetical protein [Gemmatimonadales bacterium]
MFIGHYALGLAAKRLAPRTSLGTLIAAPTFADLIWPVFLLLGWERVSVAGGTNPFLTLAFDSYPISHSLVTLAGWGLLVGALYKMKTGYAQGALVVGLLVFSHWVLDWIVHIPDLPLYPGGPKVGLGLWRFAPATVVIELLMFVGGIGLYMTATRARDRIGRYGVWALLVLLALSYVGSLFSPPPGNIKALAIGGIIFGWLFVALAWWADRHRDTTLPGEASPSKPLPR